MNKISCDQNKILWNMKYFKMLNLFKTLKYTFPKSVLYLLCLYYFQDT